MDGFHGNFFAPLSAVSLEDEEFLGEMPVIVAQGERRMQVRAYCYWTDLLGARQLPLIADLKLDQIADIADHAVLLDFTHSQHDPVIAFLGVAVATECHISRAIHHLDEVPADSLLARITARYDEILASQAPVGFDDEFTNPLGVTYLYRGMLLPFASVEGGPISHVLGVVNWKECADAALSAELARLVGEALENAEAHLAVPVAPTAWVEWADRASHWPEPRFGQESPRTARERALEALGGLEGAAVPDDVARAMTLADWLASARELAQAALLTTERTRAALYAAIGRTYDFELMTRGDQRGLAHLLEEAGLAPQRRNPLVPLVRLVFGKEHDKTRVAEIASALAHGRRLGLLRGEMAAHLARVAGGLKGVVAEERRLRAAEHPRRRKNDPARDRLAALPVVPMASLAAKGPELTVLVARRMADGTLALVGEAGDDSALLARAAQVLTQG